MQSVESGAPLKQSVESDVPLMQSVESDAPLKQSVESDVPLMQSVESDAPLKQSVESDGPLMQSVESGAPLTGLSRKEVFVFYRNATITWYSTSCRLTTFHWHMSLLRWKKLRETWKWRTTVSARIHWTM